MSFNISNCHPGGYGNYALETLDEQKNAWEIVRRAPDLFHASMVALYLDQAMIVIMLSSVLVLGPPPEAELYPVLL